MLPADFALIYNAIFRSSGSSGIAAKKSSDAIDQYELFCSRKLTQAQKSIIQEAV